MFFKKTTCPNCNAHHDEMSDFCPYCGIRNEANSEFKLRHPMTFVPWYKEMTLALVGLIGFTLFNLIFAIIFQVILKEAYKENATYSLMLVNTASYLGFFLVVVILMAPYLRDIANKFKIPSAYLFGLLGFIVLLGASITMGYIIQVIRPGTGEGGNQSAVSDMVRNYPWISILIVGIIGPICEEVAYRVGLFTLLRRVHPSLAYIATALIFGFIHFDITSTDLITEFLYLPEYMFAGLVFAFVYDKKGIVGSSIAHILNNMFSILMILLIVE